MVWTEEVFIISLVLFCIESPLRVTQHFNQVSTVEDDRVSAQHLVRSSYMDVRLLSKLIKTTPITTPN